MAAPAEMEESKGNVANVFSEKYWPTELDAVLAKSEAVKKEFSARDKEINELKKNGGYFGEDFEAGIDDAALFVGADIEEEVGVAAVGGLHVPGESSGGGAGLEAFLPEPLVFELPAGFAGVGVVFGKVEGSGDGDMSECPALFSPAPPVRAGGDDGMGRAALPVGS